MVHIKWCISYGTYHRDMGRLRHIRPLRRQVQNSTLRISEKYVEKDM